MLRSGLRTFFLVLFLASVVPPGLRRRRRLRNTVVERLGLGLHLVDYNLPLEDLIVLVETQAQAMR